MSSFLVNCPQCGITIAKGIPCPDCRWSENTENSEVSNHETLHEFALREQTHKRNYTAFMLLSFAVGLIGLLTAVMWVLVIYRGNLLAFICIGLFTVLTGALSVALFFLERWMPVDLNCPNCEIRLDQMGTIESHCPSCGVQLKPDLPVDHQVPAELTC